MNPESEKISELNRYINLSSLSPKEELIAVQ
jgi:hypothetical protein